MQVRGTPSTLNGGLLGATDLATRSVLESVSVSTSLFLKRIRITIKGRVRVRDSPGFLIPSILPTVTAPASPPGRKPRPIPVLKSSVVFSWHVTDGNHGLGATAGLSSSVRIEDTAGQASSGARKSIRDYFREIYMAVSRGTTRPRLDYPPLRVFWFKGKAFTEGIETHKRDGVSVRAYSAEKTLADCFKYRNKIGIDIVVEALKLYQQRKTVRVDELLRFARVCRVFKIMKPYLEALL